MTRVFRHAIIVFKVIMRHCGPDIGPQVGRKGGMGTMRKRILSIAARAALLLLLPVR